MSLQSLRKDQLLQLAKEFEVEVAEDDTKPEIINALQENNISYSTWKKFVGDDEETPQQEEATESEVTFDQPEKVLLKMDRQNATFEAFGYTFTRSHPFQAVDTDTAQRIIDSFEGFRVASPKEVQNYYS